ncbi:MAG TPA: diacylglycerol kinase family protein [Pirellulaceae bacterium]|nr:diacylglycerol kinase family protein [Pirellulaceae bacterium]
MTIPLTQIDSRATEVLIAVNPNAGSRAQMPIVEDLVHQLTTLNFHATVFHEIDALAAAAAEQTVAGTLRAVVAAGGDGTARLVAEMTHEGTPLTILPLGTENLLAQHLELSTDTRAIALRIAAGLTVRLDAGQANGRLFTLMVGCGFDADVVQRLHRDRRGHIHHLSYIKPIVDSIRNYDYPPLRVHYRKVNGKSAVLTARWVFVVNLPRYAGGLNFAPSASGTDGLLDICTFREGSLWSGLLYLGGVVLGQHEAMEDFFQAHSTEMKIESKAQVPYQIDGDPGGELPLSISVLPQRLTVLVTRPWAERYGFDTEERVMM